MMDNLGLHPYYNHRPPYKILFSLASSTTRPVQMDDEIALLRKTLNPKLAIVEEYYFHKYSLREQAEITSQASIYVSGCGGGAVTSIFLPRGASALLYYPPKLGHTTNPFKFTKTPARLDWDLFNNMGYIRAHWFPRNSKKEDLNVFLEVIQHELRNLQREFSDQETSDS